MMAQDLYLLNQFFAVIIYFLPAILFIGTWKFIVFIVYLVRKNRRNNGLETLEDCHQRVLSLEDDIVVKSNKIKALQAKIKLLERREKAIASALELR